MTVELFLTKIGRDSLQHAQHFKTWEELFSSRSHEFKRKQVPLKDRKYIMAYDSL